MPCRSVVAGLVLLLVLGAEVQAQDPPPPVQRGQNRSTPLYNSTTGALGVDGQMTWREWWYTFREGSDLVIAGQGTFSFAVAGNEGMVADRDLEDFEIILEHGVAGCANDSWTPVPNSKGIRLSAALSVRSDGAVTGGLGISGNVRVDGTTITAYRGTAKKAKWWVDIDDTSATAESGVSSMLFFAEWRCPIPAGGTAPSLTGIWSNVLIEIDDWGEDTQHMISPHSSSGRGSTCTNPDGEGWGDWTPVAVSQSVETASCAEVAAGLETLALASSGPAAEVFAPPAAVAGGRIAGMVLSEAGEPVSNTTVRVATLSGTVEVETDDDGEFVAEVPSGSDSLTVSVPGLLAQAIPVAASLAEMMRSTGAEPSSEPPPFSEVGQPVGLRGHYPAVAIERPRSALPSTLPQGMATEFEPGMASIRAPTALAIAPTGEAVTYYTVPEALGAGPSTVVIGGPDGAQRFETSAFRLVSASIDQENLRSGQQAEFLYRFDFGPGAPRQVQVTIDVTGAITYAQNGQPQILQVGADGMAEVRGSVQAQQGSPSGAPFEITPRLGMVGG